MDKNIAVEVVATKILLIRGKKVMVGMDLARLYGTSTKVLNQAVKRNIKRFPEDFCFKLNEVEKNELVTNCDQFKTMKHSSTLPYVFTEQGVAMLSTVLNSERAIQVNIMIMRAFVKLKEILLTHKELTIKLESLDNKYSDHDKKIKAIFEAIRQLLEPPKVKEKRIIGFGK